MTHSLIATRPLRTHQYVCVWSFSCIATAIIVAATLIPNLHVSTHCDYAPAHCTTWETLTNRSFARRFSDNPVGLRSISKKILLWNLDIWTKQVVLRKGLPLGGRTYTPSKHYGSLGLTTYGNACHISTHLLDEDTGQEMISIGANTCECSQCVYYQNKTSIVCWVVNQALTLNDPCAADRHAARTKERGAATGLLIALFFFVVGVLLACVSVHGRTDYRLVQDH